MTDLVVTVNNWADLQPRLDADHSHYLAHDEPPTAERVYVVAHGKLRGWSVLARASRWTDAPGDGRWVLHCRGFFTPCTIPEPIKGFRGFRVRWWEHTDEAPFERWREVAVKHKGPIKRRKKKPGPKTQGGLF